MTTALVVCTANVCRSPMAAALLARHLDGLGSRTRVMSSGTHATAGSAAADLAVAVMADREIDLSEHRPRRLARDDIRYADAVITMECAHVAEIVAMDAAAFPKTYCARELVGRAERCAPRGDGEAVDDYLARLHRGRRAADILRLAGELDIADPMGQSRDAFERSAKELDELMRAVAIAVQ